MSYGNMSIEQFNQNFLDIVEDKSMVKEARLAGSKYVRMKLREEGVARRYFEDVERVTEEDNRYQVDDQNSDTGYMLLDREPDSYALSLTAKGEPTAEYVQGDKWKVPFQKYASPEFEKNEMELRNIRIPITDIIRSNVVLDMQEKEDQDFFAKCDAAIDQTDNIYNSTNKVLSKNDLRPLFNMIDTKRLESGVVVMAKSTLNDIYEWDHTEVGGLITDVVENGVERKKIAGKRLITTTNTDVILPGEVYTFTDPEFFGEMYDLGDPKFWLQKEKDLFKMSAWYYNGFNIGNIKSVGKMVLADSEAANRL